MKKHRRRLGSFSVFAAYGMRSKEIVAASCIESVVEYAALIALGFLLGVFCAKQLSDIWIDDTSIIGAALLLVGVIVLVVFVQSLLTALSLQENKLYRHLIEEA